MADNTDDVLSVLLSAVGPEEIASAGRILMLHGAPCPDAASVFLDKDVSVVQPMWGVAQACEQVGWSVIDAPFGVYDLVFIAVPKGMVEARGLLAVALQHRAQGAPVYVAAHNRAGGGRLQALLQEFGGRDLHSVSARKCRCIRASVFDASQDKIDASQHFLRVQAVAGGAFMSQPGVYGWDKVDVGSARLAECLPVRVKARRAADFGCGYGYLTRMLLERMVPPYRVFAVDVDKRAVDMCARNNPDNAGLQTMWADITASHTLPEALDCIVMNPPFHTGKASDVSLGQAFIQRAAEALRPGGVLWMVANVHLPYERSLQAHFSSVERMSVRDGFKVFCAVR